MRLARSVLAGLFVGCLVGTTACDTPDGDYPADGPVFRIFPSFAGRPTTVHVWQSTEEWQFCLPALGQFLIKLDCEDTREKTVRIESITCEPACSDVHFEGGDGSFVSDRERFMVTITADVEGTRAEKTEEVISTTLP